MFENNGQNYSKIKIIDFGLSTYSYELNNKCNCGTPFY